MSAEMETRRLDPLLLAGKIFTILIQIVLAIGAVALLIAIPVILFAQGMIAAELAQEMPDLDTPFPATAIAGVMTIGLAMIAALFVFFGKLRRIIGTVGDGDPFVPENAERLSLMAWLMLGVNLAIIPAAALGLMLVDFARAATEAGTDDIDVTFVSGGSLDFSGLLLVIILFILARVFRHGAAMREDLEGTV